MQRIVSTVLCVFLFTAAAFARDHKKKLRRAHRKEQTITVYGCAKVDLQCPLLVPFAGTTGTETYSLMPGTHIELGSPYRITGTIVEPNTCLTKFKMLKPKKLTKLRSTRC